MEETAGVCGVGTLFSFFFFPRSLAGWRDRGGEEEKVVRRVGVGVVVDGWRSANYSPNLPVISTIV